jgi:hypothetical protein
MMMRRGAASIAGHRDIHFDAARSPIRSILKEILLPISAPIPAPDLPAAHLRTRIGDFATDAGRHLAADLSLGGLMPRIKVGDVAPDLELPAVLGERRHSFRLSDYRGKKNVVLAFYALNWTPV